MVSKIQLTPDDYDLQQGWTNVLEAFAQTAKVKLDTNRVLTPDDVIAQLESNQDKEDVDGEKYKVVKLVLRRTLACIQTLGGIAASGASMAFPPAGLVYSGLSYLITAGEKYGNIFSSLQGLLKEVSDVMERMTVYLGAKQIDRPLRKIVHELLQSIVSICGFSIRVLRHNKFWMFLKVFAFNEDEGVTGELEKLRALVNRELQMKTTLTYAIVADMNEGVADVKSVVEKMAEDSRKRENESADRKQLDKIRAALGVQELIDKQSEFNTRLWTETVSETGQWLQETEAYKSWADRNTAFNKVVFLSADAGFGKTFLMTSAIHTLQKRYTGQTESAERTMIAYYHLLPPDSKATHGSDEKAFSVDKILKAIALQFAQDAVYRKALAGFCDKWTEAENIEELFIRLMSPCYNSAEVFYVLIDGIELADEKQLHGLSQLLKAVRNRFTLEQQSHVRFLFSGRVSVVNSISKKLEYPSEVIDVASNNGPDIEKFIRDRLATLTLLQGESEQMKKLREEVFEVLTTNSRGDFINIGLLLKEISTKQWPAEIREVLATAKAGTNREDTIAREIARCNDTLSAQEIRDLNTMLLWVLASKSPLPVATLDAVLFLPNNETSLRPLHERIREKYSSFFRMDEVFGSAGESGYLVSLVSDSIRDYFEAQSSTLEAAAMDQSKISDSEVKIIRRFLTSVCDQELYGKFGFDKFFSEKVSSSTVMVDVDLERAPSTLLLGCLQGLLSTAPEMRMLWLYALDHFRLHLADIDLSMTDPAVKTNIGRLLVSILTDERVLEHWWTWETIIIKKWFFFVDETVETILNWFRDSAVTKGLSESNKAWVKSLISNSSPDSDVMEHVVRFLCQQLFQANRWIPLKQTYSAIAGYRTKIKHRTDSTVQRIVEDLEDEDVSTDDIIEISNWASILLGVDAEKDYQWNRCLGRILRQYQEIDEAIKYYKKAISLTNDAWYAQLGLASAMADNGQYQEAIEIAEDLKNRLQKGVSQVEEPEVSMGELRNSLASWYREVERYDEALKIFDEGLAANPYNYTLYKEKVLVFHKMGGYQKIFDMLEELSNAQDPNVGISKRNRFWHTMAFEDIFYNAMHEAAKQSGQMALLLSMMQQAVEDAANPNYIPLAATYKVLWSVAINFYADEIRWSIVKSSEERQAVAGAWERNLQACIASNVDKLKPLIAKRLAQYYVDSLRETKDDSPEAQTTLKKLSDLTLDDTAQDDDTLKTGLLMARYQSTRGNQENAMKLTRGVVKVGLDLLSDEDPDNDYQGYWRLANVLMYYGDDDNALAAWSLLGPAGSDESDNKSVSADGTDEITTGVPTTSGAATKTEEPDAEVAVRLAESTQEDAAIEETNPEAGVNPEETILEVVYAPGGALEWSCDGDCDPTTTWTYANDIYVCKDCLDIAFDEKCLAKLKGEGLSENVCNPKHEHLHVPKWDPEEAKDRGKDYVRLRGDKVRVTEWLDALRKQWGFEQPAKAEVAKEIETKNSTEQANGASSDP